MFTRPKYSELKRFIEKKTVVLMCLHSLPNFATTYTICTKRIEKRNAALNRCEQHMF